MTGNGRGKKANYRNIYEDGIELYLRLRLQPWIISEMI